MKQVNTLEHTLLNERNRRHILAICGVLDGNEILADKIVSVSPTWRRGHGQTQSIQINNKFHDKEQENSLLYPILPANTRSTSAVKLLALNALH